MKKLYSLFLLLPLQALAQPVLPNVENFSVGFSARYMECSVVAPGPAGAAQTWDFSTLSPINSSDTSILSVTAVPAGSTFTGANMVMHQPGGRTIFLNKTAAETEIMGIVDTPNVATIKYTDPVKNMVRPMTFGTNFTDVCAEVDTLQGSPANGTGNIVVNADGHGTLKLPGGQTFNNVLRVKSVQTQVDTVDFGGPIPVTITLINHTWYDEGHQAPLLQMISADINSAIFTAQDDHVLYLLKENYPSNVPGITPTADKVAAYIGGRKLVLNGNFEYNREYSLALYSVGDGKRVLGHSFIAGSGAQIINMEKELAAGMYVVVVTDLKTGAANTIKVVKE